MMTKEQIERWTEDQLEGMTFEELLEEFELTPGEVIYHLFRCGLIDEELIILATDNE